MVSKREGKPVKASVALPLAMHRESLVMFLALHGRCSPQGQGARGTGAQGKGRGGGCNCSGLDEARYGLLQDEQVSDDRRLKS